MNTREKKKLRVKYVKYIENCITNFDTLYKDTEIEISYFKELLMYAKFCDHHTFYEHHQKYNWPRNNHVEHYHNITSHTGYKWDSLINLREDPMLNRIVMLKSLDI